jgi:hypothetical protein
VCIQTMCYMQIARPYNQVAPNHFRCEKLKQKDPEHGGSPNPWWVCNSFIVRSLHTLTMNEPQALVQEIVSVVARQCAIVSKALLRLVVTASPVLPSRLIPSRGQTSTTNVTDRPSGHATSSLVSVDQEDHIHCHTTIQNQG